MAEADRYEDVVRTRNDEKFAEEIAEFLEDRGATLSTAAFRRTGIDQLDLFG